MSTISIIAAIADKSAIGKNQQLLCHMPSEAFQGINHGTCGNHGT